MSVRLGFRKGGHKYQTIITGGRKVFLYKIYKTLNTPPGGGGVTTQGERKYREIKSTHACL